MVLKRILFLLNMVIGAGGIAGGFLALSPNARISVGIDTSMLVNSPFTTFLIPGLFLLLIIGVGNLTVGRLNIRSKYSPYYECLMGMIQCAWIVIQCLMLLAVNWLHVLFFIFGLIQLCSGFYLVRKGNIPFPFSAQQN